MHAAGVLRLLHRGAGKRSAEEFPACSFVNEDAAASVGSDRSTRIGTHATPCPWDRGGHYIFCIVISASLGWLDSLKTSELVVATALEVGWKCLPGTESRAVAQSLHGKTGPVMHEWQRDITYHIILSAPHTTVDGTFTPPGYPASEQDWINVVQISPRYPANFKPPHPNQRASSLQSGSDSFSFRSQVVAGVVGGWLKGRYLGPSSWPKVFRCSLAWLVSVYAGLSTEYISEICLSCQQPSLRCTQA